MKLKTKILFVMLVFIAQFSFGQNSNIIDGELIVMINKSVTVNSFCDKINSKNSGIELEVKDIISRKINVWLLSYNKTNFSPQEALEVLNASSEAILSQYNHTNILLRGDTCPTDPFFSTKQWNLKNTGLNSGVAGADIDACKAWGLSTNKVTAHGDTIVVAVIDNGFYLPHDDISFFKNYNEIPNNNIDDDGNGYIDDVQGWNTYLDTNYIPFGNHGTGVSGVIGANANNGIGVSGVNWGMKILPIHGSSESESVVLKSYGYALEMRALYDSTNGAKGAYVVATNSSFGINNANASGFPLWCAFYDSLGAYGILSVAATANSNTNVDVYGDMPTTCTSDFLISVTSTTRTDNKVGDAGYGAIHIDIGAPGANIRMAVSGNSYFDDNGTSFASPHVAGAIGFMFSVACSGYMDLYKANPDSMALEIKDAILTYSDSNANLLGLTTSGKRLNIYYPALHIISSVPCSPVGVNENREDNSSILLYPNPNNGLFNVELTNFEKGAYQYTILDVSGKLIKKKEFDLHNSFTSIKINTYEIDKGVYFLCFKSANGFSKIVKFVKD